MNRANKLGIKVIIDLVVNHTSDQHPWFQTARKDKKSKYRDWYVWSDTRPPNWNEGIVFPGFQEAIWSYDERAGQYYYHRFYDFEPDLNMDNPDLRTEVRRIMGYWLELGVRGSAWTSCRSS
jgi:maltose alpha-D-glucosyltransferase/alpha-amylase